MENLRECPCCGKAAQGKAAYNPGRNQGFMRGWVGCPACGLYIQWTHDPSGAIRKWNRRAGGTLRLDGSVPHQSPAGQLPPGEAGPLRQGRGGVKREILIKGMDMPSLYKTYKVRFAGTDGGKIVVGIANEDSTEYTPAGEAVFVPPHGRLIDADILYRVAVDRAEKRGDMFNELDNVLSPRSIEMTPTVLPADEGGPSFGGCGGDGA